MSPIKAIAVVSNLIIFKANFIIIRELMWVFCVIIDMAASRVSNCCRGAVRRVVCVRVRAVARRPRARWRARSHLWTSKVPVRLIPPSISWMKGPWPPSIMNPPPYPAQPPHNLGKGLVRRVATPQQIVNNRGFKTLMGKLRETDTESS